MVGVRKRNYSLETVARLSKSRYCRERLMTYDQADGGNRSLCVCFFALVMHGTILQFFFLVACLAGSTKCGPKHQPIRHSIDHYINKHLVRCVFLRPISLCAVRCRYLSFAPLAGSPSSSTPPTPTGTGTIYATIDAVITRYSRFLSWQVSCWCERYSRFSSRHAF